MKAYRSSTWQQSPAGYVRGIACGCCGYDVAPHYLSLRGHCIDCTTDASNQPRQRRQIPATVLPPRPRRAPLPRLSKAEIARLAGWERRIYQFLMEGKTQAATARALSITEAAVSKAARMIRAAVDASKSRQSAA